MDFRSICLFYLLMTLAVGNQIICVPVIHGQSFFPFFVGAYFIYFLTGLCELLQRAMPKNSNFFKKAKEHLWTQSKLTAPCWIAAELCFRSKLFKKHGYVYGLVGPLALLNFIAHNDRDEADEILDMIKRFATFTIYSECIYHRSYLGTAAAHVLANIENIVMINNLDLYILRNRVRISCPTIMALVAANVSIGLFSAALCHPHNDWSLDV